MPSVGLNMEYEVKDLVQTIDFYNILFGEQAGELYPGHAVYTVKTPSITLRFRENPNTVPQGCGHFCLEYQSDDEVYQRFSRFTGSGFARKVKIDGQVFGTNNHSFSISDPDGICWKVAVKEKKIQPFKLFNIPRMTSMWDILKPI